MTSDDDHAAWLDLEAILLAAGANDAEIEVLWGEVVALS